MRQKGASSSLNSYYLVSINSCLTRPWSNPSLGSSFGKLCWSPTLLLLDGSQRCVGAQDGRDFFPRSDIGRTEIRSQVVVAPASVVTDKLVKMAGFWMHFKVDVSRILWGVGLEMQKTEWDKQWFHQICREWLEGCSCNHPGKGKIWQIKSGDEIWRC